MENYPLENNQQFKDLRVGLLDPLEHDQILNTSTPAVLYVLSIQNIDALSSD